MVYTCETGLRRRPWPRTVIMMDGSLAPPSAWFRIVLSVALATAAVWLAVGVAGWGEHDEAGLRAGSFIVLAVPVLTLLACLHAWSTVDRELRRRRFDEALLVPCALAPLALMAPWLAVRTRSYGVFYDTLPALVERQLRSDIDGLVGIGVLLTTCFLPAALAFRGSTHSRAFVSLGVLCLLQVVAYAWVAVFIDATTMFTVFEVALVGPGIVPETLDLTNLVLAADLGAGALLRLAATIAVVAFAVRLYLRRHEPPAVWETP